MKPYENPEFLKAYESGMSRPEMQKKLNARPGTLSDWILKALKAGLVKRRPVHNLLARELTEEQLAEAIEMRRKAISIRNIAVHLNVSERLITKSLPKSERRRISWTEEMDRTLIKHYPTQMTAENIGRLVGRSATQVMWRAGKLGLRSPVIANAWTPEEDAILTRMWKQGCAPSEIEGEIKGRSRSSISGRAARLGLPPNGNYPVTRRPANRDYESVRQANAQRAGKPRARLIKIERMEDHAVPEYARPWLERKFGECAYPFGARNQIHSCCKPVFGSSSYCEGHAALCFQQAA